MTSAGLLRAVMGEFRDQLNDCGDRVNPAALRPGGVADPASEDREGFIQSMSCLLLCSLLKPYPSQSQPCLALAERPSNIPKDTNFKRGTKKQAQRNWPEICR